MQPEPPEFQVSEKVTFKHIKRESEKTTFTRQVGTVTYIRWITPFYEFTLSGEHVDAGRWYKQTELDKYKKGDEVANRAAEAEVLSTTRSALESARSGSENLRKQNESLSVIMTGQAADLTTARALISDLEGSEGNARSAIEVIDASLLQAYQDLEAARVEVESCKEQIGTLSNVADLGAELATALAQIAELEPLREQLATLAKALEGHDAVKAELEAARDRIIELEKQVAGREELEAIVQRLERLALASVAPTSDAGS